MMDYVDALAQLLAGAAYIIIFVVAQAAINGMNGRTPIIVRLAFWLLLIGAVGAHLPASERFGFWAGCISASVSWFTLLGYGSARLAPLFARPQSWRVLDGAIGLMMGWLAWGLIH